MYKIYADNELIYDPTTSDYLITSGQLQLALNTSGSLVFTLPRSNPSFGRIKLMKSIITLYEDDRLLFRGRAYAPSVDLFQLDTIECEGELAFFNDSVQKPFDYPIGDVRGLLELVVNEHNKQMPSDKQFVVGEVTVRHDTSSGQIHRSSIEYLSTWELLKEKFLKPLGGYFWLRRVGDKTYIDYLESLNFEGTQTIQQAVNLIDAKKVVSSENLATAILPIGARLKNEQGEETDSYLTLQDSTGKLTVEDTNGISQYGYIVKVVKHDDITTADALLRAARKDLADALGVTTTTTLSAADLSKAGYDFTPFLVGTKILVKVPNLTIDSRMLVESLSIDLLHPESNTLTVGHSEKSFTHHQLQTKETIETVKRDVRTQVKSARESAVIRAVREAGSHMTQTASEIRSEVSDAYYNKEQANQLLESIKTIISQKANEITFQFNEYKRDQESINGETSNRFAEITKYIRFVNGDILLGEVGNATTLRIENDRIVFQESGVDSAYWQSRQFYASEGEFLNRLKLGKFAFIPRTSGNLSFTKVVD